MNPQLVCISGPLKDSTFELSREETQIGRDSSNTVAISDLALSRRHCAIKRAGDQFTILDLGSRNGTFVNGAAIAQEVALRHGDQISLGDSIFIALLREEPTLPEAGGVQFEDSATQATHQLQPQDAVYLHPDRVSSQLASSPRFGQNLNALLKISQVVHGIRDPGELQSQILDVLFELVPAERGALLMDGGRNGQFGSATARHRAPLAAQPVRVSRTITGQVLETGMAVLGADVPYRGGLGKVESIVSSCTRSLLCVPLTLFKKINGCIYLDTTNPAERFDQDHLQLATSVAEIAGVALENARRMQWLERENRRLATEISLEHNMVGESPLMKEVYQLLARVATKDSTVLIEGESGTGKELAARAIHRNSPRHNQPFVAINCATIPAALMESELFGHERGAFTDAFAQKRGKLELANGGVVFLDEIGELPLALQVKLLRVLQEREFERVGGTTPITVDIRLIAATNRDLEEGVRANNFRLDLYYRLNVVRVVMPPLRERREDIEALSNHFALKSSRKCKTKAKRISPEATACLVNYDWPGNVRELENAIERATVLGESEVILPEDLPEAVLEKGPADGVAAGRYHQAITELKRDLIRKALEKAGGNFTEAARFLGVHPNYLHRLVSNLDLRETARAGINGRRAKKFK